MTRRSSLPSNRMRRPVVPAVVLALALVVVACASATPRQATALRLVPFAAGFSSPIQVTAPRGSRGVVYVVEQGGLVRVVKAGKVQAQPFLDVRSLTQAGGEQGLLGLAFAPNYATSRQFVIDYTDRNGDTRVVRYRSNGTKALPGERHATALRRPAVLEPQRRQWSPTARTGSSTSAWETAAPAATPRTGLRTRARCSARSSASTRPVPGRSP